MSENCVFCKIVRKEIKAHILFEDQKTLAFLDANPVAKGHALVIPKRHIARLENLDTDLVGALFNTVHRLIKPIQKAVNAPASLIAINNGPESGQGVAHIHVHIIPRFKGDEKRSIHTITRQEIELSEIDMKNIGKTVRDFTR